MPSSADDTTTHDDANHLKVPLSKKQAKKAKRAAAAAKLLSDQQDESSGLEGTTPPIDFLAPPSTTNDLSLSSSPEAAISEPEAPCPETPPIFAQEIHDIDERKVPPLIAHDAETIEEETPASNGHGDIRNGHAQLPSHTHPLSSSPNPAPMSPSSKAASPKQPVPRATPAGTPQKHTSLMDAPLPHMPQRHFSRAPDTTFGLQSADNEIIPGTGDYFCGFDTLDGTTADPHDSGANILLVGSEGALDICRYNRNRREVIGRLEGLRGSVINARMVPTPSGPDPLAQYRPMIACVLHGPLIKTERSQDAQLIDHYQTTVDVFSLKKSKHLATLYTAAAQPLEHPVGHAQFTAPKPEDFISLSAEGRYIVVSSGVSGEVFIFVADGSGSGDEPLFRSIGKLWTTTRDLQTLIPPDGVQNDVRPEEALSRPMPILSLSRRWLALSPPAVSSAQKSADGTASLIAGRALPPGVSSYVSAPPPTLDCEVDAPSGSSLLNRVTKQATNEIRKGAQWVGEQGMGVIKSYWNRPPSGETTPNASPAQKPVEEQRPNFPPTHAQGRDRPAVKVETSLVSIFDLDKLADFDLGRVKNPLAPIATFSLVDGCSFLSFAPSGLALLTTNQVGDASTAWDLIRVTDQSAASRLTMTTPQLQHPTGLVRRACVFSRLSPSSVVDVRWTAASNRVGIVTSKGTLHLHEIPKHDPLAAALRSPASPAGLPRSDLPSPSTSPQDLPSGFMNNVRSGWQNVSGRINAIRAASESGNSIVSSTRQSLNQASVAARYASGRAVRNGYNTALEGAYSLRHSQDNKIRLKSLHHTVRLGCFRWMSGKDEGLISTVADGVLYIYAVKSNYHVQGKRTTIVLDASKKAGPAQTLPLVTAGSLPPAACGLLNPDGPHASCAKAGVHGFWTLHRDTPVAVPLVVQPASSVQQDKETCPQHQPLHRLKQVSLFVYDETKPGNVDKALGAADNMAPWCFGGPLVLVERVTVAPNKAAPDGDQRAYEDVVGHMEDDFNAGQAQA